MSKIPPIIKDDLVLDVNEQIKITLFPDNVGQPEIDIVRLDLRQLEGNIQTVFMTPCEALDIANGLISTVQMYLFNQEEYRKKILEPRLKLAKKRKPKK